MANPIGSEVNSITPASVRMEIWGSLRESKLDNTKFLPESSVSQLTTKPIVSALLAGALPDIPGLVKFVCDHARRLFLIVLWIFDGDDDDVTRNLICAMENFRQHNFTDEHLPIEDIAKDKVCKADVFWGSPNNLDCTHDATLNVFHHNPWRWSTFQRFYEKQWVFSSPVFEKDKLVQDLQIHSILPFTWVSPSHTWKQGYFSTVFKAKLLADHHEEFPQVRCSDSLDNSL
jgi:hypothetical protein